MKMNEPFQAVLEFAEQLPNLPPAVPPAVVQVTPEATLKTTYIESINRTDLQQTTYEVAGSKQPNGTVTGTLIVKKQGWATE